MAFDFSLPFLALKKVCQRIPSTPSRTNSAHHRKEPRMYSIMKNSWQEKVPFCSQTIKIRRNRLIFRFFLYFYDRIKATCPDILRNLKKRYAYLVNWKPRKFLNHAQGWHSGSHAIAWAAITISVLKVFPTTSNLDMVAFAVPRFCGLIK